MWITTFDLEERKRCGIEVPLRRLAASLDPLKAACWRKVLELVEQLESNRLEREIWGHIVIDESGTEQTGTARPGS